MTGRRGGAGRPSGAGRGGEGAALASLLSWTFERRPERWRALHAVHAAGPWRRLDSLIASSGPHQAAVAQLPPAPAHAALHRTALAKQCIHRDSATPNPPWAVPWNRLGRMRGGRRNLRNIPGNSQNTPAGLPHLFPPRHCHGVRQRGGALRPGAESECYSVCFFFTAREHGSLECRAGGQPTTCRCCCCAGQRCLAAAAMRSCLSMPSGGSNAATNLCLSARARPKRAARAVPAAQAWALGRRWASRGKQEVLLLCGLPDRPPSPPPTHCLPARLPAGRGPAIRRRGE